ncbi:MAG: polysaccharide deacetylase family protein [Abitibacteriaceae bacterium]|nr:polysaccharide deacetylase family protein [Abditibacteriaceae bacterium]
MLRVLAYHRVLDDDPETFPFDEALISASSEVFQQQMEFVRRNFEVLSFEDLEHCQREGRPWPKRSVIITFDDGYRDNYTHAFPILKALKLPAAIFISTSYMGDCTKLFWWDLVAYCFKHTKRSEVEFPQVHHQPLPLTSARDRHRAILRILRWAKQVPDEVKNQFIDQLAASLEIELPSDIAAGMHLTWEQIKEMADGGIEFGSHTVTHPILANVNEAQLETEICESKKIIEQHLGKEVLVISYPDGRKPHYNEQVQQLAKAAGFHFGIAYEEGPVSEKKCDYFAMPRIHVEQDQTMSLFRANLMFPKIMMMRKNNIQHHRSELHS